MKEPQDGQVGLLAAVGGSTHKVKRPGRSKQLAYHSLQFLRQTIEHPPASSLVF